MKTGSVPSVQSDKVWNPEDIDPSTVVPTGEHDLVGGCVKVLTFGRDLDYSSPLRNPKAMQVIAHHAREHGVNAIFAPWASGANAAVVSAETDLFPDRERVNDVRFYGGAKADGVRLHYGGTGFFIDSGDCPTLVARFGFTGHVYAMHCALRSLIDPSAYGGSVSSDRKPGSVIDELIQNHAFGRNLVF
jgi:hypothetical protein